MPDITNRLFSGIKMQILPDNPVNLPDIVYAVHMVGMRMRIKHPVQIANIIASSCKRKSGDVSINNLTPSYSRYADVRKRRF